MNEKVDKRMGPSRDEILLNSLVNFQCVCFHLRFRMSSCSRIVKYFGTSVVMHRINGPGKQAL